MMVKNERVDEEQEGREGLGWAGRPPESGDPSEPSVRQPHPLDEFGISPIEAFENAPDEARQRAERIKFNAVKEELRRAELAFLSAKRTLPGGEGRGVAERIAEALRRCNLSIDTVAKGLAAAPAADALEGVTRFNPSSSLNEFLQMGGQALTASARAMARCGVTSIEYWGRQLLRMAAELVTAVHDGRVD